MRNLVAFLAFVSIFNVANATSHSTKTENERQWDEFVQTNMNVQLLDLGDRTQSLDGGKWNSIIIAGEHSEPQSPPALYNIPTVPYPASEVGNIMIHDSGLKDARLLSSVRKARAIIIYESELETVQGLEKLKEADSIDIENGKLSQARGLSGLERVGLLSFSGNNIENLDGLTSLKEVEKLDVNFNNVISLESLHNVEKIKEVSATDNKISSFKGLGDVGGISGIDLLRNILVNVDHIPLSASMDHIILKANYIKNLAGFKKRKVEIRVVNLRQNPVSSIQGIENFKVTEAFILDENYKGKKLPSDSPFCTSITEQIDKSGINRGGAKKSQYCM